jgi:hypothetical protein
VSLTHSSALGEYIVSLANGSRLRIANGTQNKAHTHVKGAEQIEESGSVSVSFLRLARRFCPCNVFAPSSTTLQALVIKGMISKARGAAGTLSGDVN